jgi:cell division protein FtsQ
VRAAAAATLRTLPRVALSVGSLSPRVRMGLLACLAALLSLTFLYYGWFRDSSLVEVRDVTVIGVGSTDAPRIRARLVREAQGMTTLHVDEAALRRAIGPGVSIASIRVETDFPHGMRIEVVENPPVAVLVGEGVRVPVAADGTLLRKVRAGAVPAVFVGALPSTRLGRGRALRLVGVAATAPVALRGRVMRIRELPGKGLVAYLRRGPEVILGDAADLARKWAAAAAILADEESRGAAYVDVSNPDRPVAGGVDVPQPESEQPAAGGAVQPAPAPAPAGATGAVGPVPAAGIPPVAQQTAPQSPAPGTVPQP